MLPGKLLKRSRQIVVFVVAALSSPAMAEPLTIPSETRNITLAQIAELPQTLAALGKRVVAQIPEGSRELTLSRDAQNRLLTRNLPGIEIMARYDHAVRFRTDQSDDKPELAKDQHCLHVVTPIARGEVLAKDAISSASCDDDVDGRGPVWFDRLHYVLRASRDLPAGTVIGDFATRGRGIERAGTPVIVRVRSGPITVERTGRSLQPFEVGRAAFIQLENGEVMAVPIEAHGS